MNYDPQDEFDENRFNDNQVDWNREYYYAQRRGMGWNSKTPVYDDKADYNTNSKSYYDYLARFWNYILKWITYVINRLLRRNIAVKDTASIDFVKEGDWIDNSKCKPHNYDDITTLSANVIISKATETRSMPHLSITTFTIPNGSKIKEDGVWSPDYMSILDALDKDIGDIKQDIANIYNEIQNIYNEIAGIKNDITNIKNDIQDIRNIINNQGDAIQKIINNLYESGAITTNNINNYEFVTGRNIATGNINHYLQSIGGTLFIKTTKSDANASVMGVK